MKRALVLYMPVLHNGYLTLLEKYDGNVDTIWLFGEDIAYLLNDNLRKEIRAIPASVMKAVAQGIAPSQEVHILEDANIADLLSNDQIIFADDDISHVFAEQHNLVNPLFERVFLRWDSTNIHRVNPDQYDRVVVSDEFSRAAMLKCVEEGKKTGDFWRAVGAAVISEGNFLSLGYNEHTPSALTPYILGDPRIFVLPGEHLELATALHAEVAAISQAVRATGSVEGADIFTSTFPCAACAKIIVAFGLKRCFYLLGHNTLNGYDVLTSGGVEVIKVEM